MKLFLLALVFAANTERMPQKPIQNSAPEEHIRKLIQSLPLDSKVRHELESGNYGDGIHYSWMDAMRRMDVKRAKVITEFNVSFWGRRPKKITVGRTLYFDKYDTDCAQITDAGRLHAIQTSGLQQELERFAIQKTEKTPWHVVDGGMDHPKRGSNNIDAFDDEWVPHRSAFLIPSSSPPMPELNGAILTGDEARVTEIIQAGNVRSAELDQALLLASNVIDDSCIIKTLLEAGANPNARTPDGQTPLLYAADSGNTHNVRVLLDKGAEVNVKNVFGYTAASRARERGYTTIVQLLEQAKGRHE